MHVPDNRTQLLKVALTISNAWTISGPQDFPTIHAVTPQARVAATVPAPDERATRTAFFFMSRFGLYGFEQGSHEALTERPARLTAQTERFLSRSCLL